MITFGGQSTIRSRLKARVTRSLTIGIAAGLLALSAGGVAAFGGPLAAIAVIAGTLAGVLVLRNIEYGFWSVVIVVTLLPFATLPFSVGLTPTFLDLALGATIGVWVFRIVTVRQREIATATVTLPIAIFLLAVLFSFIFGLGNGPLTSNLLRHFAELLLSIGFVLVIIDFFSTWDRIERVVRLIILAGSGAAFIGIVFWIMPDDAANTALNGLQRIGYPGGFVIRYIEENPENAERAIGTSVDPNALGGLLLMIGTLTAPQLVAKRPIMPRWLVGIAFSLLVLCLVLTFSRGAMVGFVGGLGVVIAIRYRRLLPYLVVTGLILLLLPITQGYLSRFIEGFQGQDLATQMRFGEYQDAITLIGRYPLFGVGFAGSPDIDLYLGVANVYLTIGQQMGLFGLLAFGGVIFTVFVAAASNNSKITSDSRLDPIWLGLHAALVGGLIAGIFDHYLFNIDFHHAVTAFWLFLGLAVSANRLGGIQSQIQAAVTVAPSSS